MQRIESRYPDLCLYMWGMKKNLRVHVFSCCVIPLLTLKATSKAVCFMKFSYYCNAVLGEKKIFYRYLGGFFTLSFPSLPLNLRSFSKLSVWPFFFVLCLPEQFSWDDYLKETESIAAPLHCFKQVCQILFCKSVCVCLHVTG